MGLTPSAQWVTLAHQAVNLIAKMEGKPPIRDNGKSPAKFLVIPVKKPKI